MERVEMVQLQHLKDTQDSNMYKKGLEGKVPGAGKWD